MKNIKKIKSELKYSELNQEDSKAEEIGYKVAQLLFAKFDKDNRVKTSWGSKTAKGLGLSIIRIVEGND